MKTKSEQFCKNNPQSGNALVYVLIAIALFAALSFTFTRQNKGENTNELTDAKVEMYATQLITYVAQVKSVIDQMTVTGTNINDLDFTLPSETGFNTAPHDKKVYHPAGGGLSPYSLPQGSFEDGQSPTAGFYLGLFNTVEWTNSTATDVMLTAYGLTQSLCSKINEKITGAGTIPTLGGDIKEFLIDSAYHTSSNQDMEISDCAACENKLTLCVQNTGGTIFAFYTVIAPR